MSKLAKTGSAVMRPRARLIGLIGEELISDEPVAVVELVKNSYDADASNVWVRFEGKDPDHPERIVVTDDGHGMDLNTVLKGWLEPGTLIKKEHGSSPAGRLYQGAKGIGRFAAARLAQHLFLESTKAGDTEGIVVLLDWGRFDDTSYMDEIALEYELRPLLDLAHGTRLTLEGLRQPWDEKDYERLHARLSRLISPFADIADFTVHLDIPAHPELSGEVQPPEIILEPKYILKGRLDAKGRFNGEVLVDGQRRKRFSDKKLGGIEETPLCGPFEVEVRAWDRDREGLQQFVERFGRSVKQIRSTLDTFSGVNIYRDGFRVYPYGEKGNDWLNLDNRSRQNPVRHLANNQIVGAVRISRENNPDLKDRSNREGMILNAQHAALEGWFVEVLTLLEGERYDSRPRRETREPSEPLFEHFDIKELAAQARMALGKDHPIALLVTDTEKQLRVGIERVQEVFSTLLMSAGLGHMIDIVIHEIGSPLGKINKQLAILEKQLNEYLSDEQLIVINPQIVSIKAWLSQIHGLRGRLEPQTPAKRGRATTFDVKDEIEDNFELYKALIDKQKIKYEIISPHGEVMAKMSRAALGQILANLIDNSIFWIIRDKGVGNGGRIRIHLSRLKTGFRILFNDDGPGVEESDLGKIFEPYFTRKPNGMGLGLYIASLVIEPYGKLVYRADGELPGACFEAFFERRVG